MITKCSQELLKIKELFLKYIKKNPFYISNLVKVNNIEINLSVENSITYSNKTVIIKATTKNIIVVLLGYLLAYPKKNIILNNNNIFTSRIVQYTPKEDNEDRIWELAMSGCTQIQFSVIEITNKLIELCHQLGLTVSVILSDYLEEANEIKHLKIDDIYCVDMINFIEVKRVFHSSMIWFPEYHSLDENDPQIKGYFYYEKITKKKLSTFRKEIPTKYPVHLLTSTEEITNIIGLSLLPFIYQKDIIYYNPIKSTIFLNYIKNYCQGFIYQSSSFEEDLATNFEQFFWCFSGDVDTKLAHYIRLFLKQKNIVFWTNQIKTIEKSLVENNSNDQYTSVLNGFEKINTITINHRNNWRLNLLLLRNYCDYYIHYRLSCETYVKENIHDSYQKEGISIFTKHKFAKLALKKAGYKFTEFIENYQNGVTEPNICRTHTIMEKIQFLSGLLYQQLGFNYKNFINNLNIPVTDLWRFYKLMEGQQILIEELMSEKYNFFINFGMNVMNDEIKFEDLFSWKFNPFEKQKDPKIQTININKNSISNLLYKGKIDDRAFFFVTYKENLRFNLERKLIKNATKIQIIFIGKELCSYDVLPVIDLLINKKYIQKNIKQPDKTGLMTFDLINSLNEEILNINFNTINSFGIPIGFIGFS